MIDKDYFIGLDLGTNSVGWAVTDESYNLIRAKGKDLWGIRKFEEAETSAGRRVFRISRRRRQRQVLRINLLKSYFEAEINKIDPNFFLRLENSKYDKDDKDEPVKYKSAIFNDKDLTDKQYYKKYPTIFHLRSDLIKDKSYHDPRLVYLALLNMFKHRGHFLTQSFDENQEVVDMKTLYMDFIIRVADTLGVKFDEDVDADKIKEILSDRQLSKTRKAEELEKLLHVDRKEKIKKNLIKMLSGQKIGDLKIFFDIETENKVPVNFSEASYDEQILTIQTQYGDENASMIESAKMMYDAGVLAGILHGAVYLSDARVQSYEQHKQDLKLLKSVYKRLDLDYKKMFKSEEKGSYSAYVNTNITRNKHSRRNRKGRTQDDFYGQIKKDFKGFEEDEEVKYILEKINNKDFMPKQLTYENGVIPNKVHVREMNVILKNAEEYLPFLKEKDENGLTVSQRIVKLFTFVVPYYVGPTTTRSNENGGNGWVVRKEEGQVLPWNFEQKIDINATQEQFIKRLIRECTYLGEKVLPKASLMNERYAVLNEINNLKIDDEKISVELKQEIFNDLYLSGKKVTKSRLENYLKEEREKISDKSQLTGIDNKEGGNINNQLNSYMKFYPIFGDKMKEDSYINMVEDIIYLSTIYGDSKSMLKELLKDRYGDRIDDQQLKRILGYKFKDWGRLSKEFLELQGVNAGTGEVTTIIRSLWETNNNLMELLNSPKFTFKQALEEKQRKVHKTIYSIEPEDLDEIHPSAPVKRMIWQALLIIKEITKVLGKEPTKVFVEMTREHRDDGRTKTRKDQLLELYKNVDKDVREQWVKAVENADANGTINSKRMYLYLRQMGKCMYTGADIDLDLLMQGKKYDIDHIYPRHYVKDDNLENNLVLVTKNANREKSDSYPIPDEVLNKSVYNHWRYLRKLNLISEEKYHRLTSRKEFTDDQKADFIARQYVETSQGTLGIANLLKQILPETRVVFAKAGNVSEFRNGKVMKRDENNEVIKKDGKAERYFFLKSRIVNDFHHAHDAYLNIVVGNVYDTKFTSDPKNFFKENRKKALTEEEKERRRYNLDKMFDWNVERNGKVAWIAWGENKTIETVAKVLSRGTPIETVRTFEQKGGLYDQTLYAGDVAKPGIYLPLKSKDPRMADVQKYGGFNKASITYFFLVEYDGRKNQRERMIAPLPLYIADAVGNSNAGLEEYAKSELGLKNPEVRYKKIKIKSLLRINGFYYYLGGRTGNRLFLHNAVNLKLPQATMNSVSRIEKAVEKNRIENLQEDELDKIYQIFVDKFNFSIYKRRVNSVSKKLGERKELFSTLSIVDKAKVVIELFELVNIGPVSANLTIIGESGGSGSLKVLSVLSKFEEFKLINQSPAGLFEEEIDLLKV